MVSSYNEPGVRLLRDGDTIEQQPASGEEAPELLSINRLTIGFTDRSASRQLVRNVSLSIRQGEMLALIGQSGSGKSLTAAAIGGMLQSPLRAVWQLRFKDRVFDNLDGVRRKHLRGKEIGWVSELPRQLYPVPSNRRSAA
ncbi:ATP-binding cassette domain-containing protein [Paenibacillus thalictri]|nr:ATP-binding cassette domain-containing protein [Paenibacillus thalictri]